MRKLIVISAWAAMLASLLALIPAVVLADSLFAAAGAAGILLLLGAVSAFVADEYDE